MMRLSKRLETVVSMAARKPERAGAGRVKPGGELDGIAAGRAESGDMSGGTAAGRAESGDMSGETGAGRAKSRDMSGGTATGRAESGDMSGETGAGRTRSGDELNRIGAGQMESGDELGRAGTDRTESRNMLGETGAGRVEPDGAGENCKDGDSECISYRVADVGTDHGYVPVALALRDPAVTAIAMDVRPGPLERAREHIAEYGLEARIETRLGDGVEKLEAGEADTVVVAGMGGELVIHILEGGRRLWDCVERWILSPQSELDKVRRYLDGHEFAITDEVMVEEDGKYYTVMEVRHSDSRRTGQGRECPTGSRRGAVSGRREAEPAIGKASDEEQREAEPAVGKASDEGQREAEPAVGKASNEEHREMISAAAAEDHILKQIGYLYGPRLIEKKDPVLLGFLEKEERQLTEIMDRLAGRDNPKTAARREELGRKRDLARRALEKIKSSSGEGGMPEVSLSVRDEPDIGLPPPQEQRREE